jgi:heme-degrading monooxygenase HmoA
MGEIEFWGGVFPINQILKREGTMYIRMTFFKVKQGMMDDLRNQYVNRVIPAHKEHKGVRFVHLLESREPDDEGISLTAWDSQGDLEAYERSGDYQKILAIFASHFAGEPTKKSYEVTSSSEPMILRIF